MPRVIQRASDLPEAVRQLVPPRAWFVWMNRYNRVISATDCADCAEKAAYLEIERRGYELRADGQYVATDRVCHSCGG